MTQMITVECSDGTLIDVDKHMAITMSGAIRKRLEDKTFDENTTIVLDNITSNTLLKVLEFCSVHTSPQVPNLKVWDEKFVRLEPGELCELASAAYYLEIKPLVDLTCKAIAKLLKGKPPAEIRRTFNILYDFSPGDDVPPPTIRDKLRTKLHYKQKDRNSRIQEEPEEDTRSVDDLVSFIDGDSNNNNNNNSNNNNNNNNKLTTSTSNNSLSSLTSKKKKTKKPKSLSTSSNNANSNNSNNNNNNNNNSNNSSASNSLRTSSGSQSESPITSPKQQRENNNSILRNYEISNISDTKDPQLRPHRESLTSKKNNKGLYSMIFDDMSEDMWASEEDEDLDPELKAAQDREVEEFRKRLESIQTSGSRPKITITGNSNPELKGSKSKLAKV